METGGNRSKKKNFVSVKVVQKEKSSRSEGSRILVRHFRGKGKFLKNKHGKKGLRGVGGEERSPEKRKGRKAYIGKERCSNAGPRGKKERRSVWNWREEGERDEKEEKTHWGFKETPKIERASGWETAW